MKKGLRRARRDAMYQQVVARVTREASDLPPANRCLHYARHTVDVIRERGVRAIIQAGSCTWPRVRPENDDGKIMTHFGYLWSPMDPNSIHSMLVGNLPEMHIWVALPGQGEIVDMTTGFLQEQAKNLCGMDWPGDPPPQYLWTTAERLPRGVTYEPVPEAIAYVLDLIAREWGGERLKSILPEPMSVEPPTVGEEELILVLFRGNCARCDKLVEMRVRPDACGENGAAMVVCPNCARSGKEYAVALARIGPDPNWEEHLMGQ